MHKSVCGGADRSTQYVSMQPVSWFEQGACSSPQGVILFHALSFSPTFLHVCEDDDFLPLPQIRQMCTWHIYLAHSLTTSSIFLGPASALCHCPEKPDIIFRIFFFFLDMKKVAKFYSIIIINN